MRVRLFKYPGSKWLKHKVLMENEQLASILPATTIFHQAALRDYLLEFPTIYIKPNKGSGGNKVIKLINTENHLAVQTCKRTIKFKKKNRATAYIRRLIKDRKYLIQQGIDVIRLHHSPIDFRVLLCKQNGFWQWYGLIGRRGKAGAAVTNRAQGGKAIPFTEAMIQTLNWNENQIAEMYHNIQQYSLIIADTLNQYFPNINQLGLDMAIDTEGRLFLIEANTRPHYHLFRHHEDRKLYAKVSRTISALRKPKKSNRRTARTTIKRFRKNKRKISKTSGKPLRNRNRYHI